LKASEYNARMEVQFNDSCMSHKVYEWGKIKIFSLPQISPNYDLNIED
jgi:hypothetical protein